MNYLVMHKGCNFVDGFANSIITDFQRGKFIVVPKSLSTIIKECTIKSIDLIKNELNEEYLQYFNEYVEFIINNEFGFITNSPECFFNNDNFNYVNENYNLICEDENIISNFDNLIINLKVVALYLRINNEYEEKRLKFIFDSLLKNSNLKYIQISTDYNQKFNEKKINALIKKYPILGLIQIFSAPSNKKYVFSETTIEYLTNSFNGIKSCGVILPTYFGCNFRLFHESQLYNNCLFNKVAITKDGDIKNCLSLPESYGNIRETTITDAIEKPGFKKYWNINKDKISVCKDCEFRYICTDCRAYVEDPHDISGPNGTNLSKPLKCGYNPYTGEWSEWSTNPLKQKAIDYYGMRDMVNDLNDVNKDS